MTPNLDYNILFILILTEGFDEFAKSQSKFVYAVAELAAKPSNAESLYDMDVVETVMSLVTNANLTVRMNVVLCLARLSNYSEPCAKRIMCSTNQLQLLLGQIDSENKYYKKNSMNLIKNISKHSPSYTLSLIKECGGLDAISICLKDLDVHVRESALLAISSIASHDDSISTFFVKSGLLTPIAQCLKEQQQNLKLYALSALNEIAKHNQDLAKKIVNANCLPTVINFLLPSVTDIKVQKSAFTLIKNVVKHSLFLTESAIELNLIPNILLLMAHPDESIRNNSAKVVCEIVKQSVQIADKVVKTGGISALLNVISCSKAFPCTHAVLALGFLARSSPIFSLAIIQSKALVHLTSILKNHNTDSYIKAGTVWTLGMIGQHSHEHARYISNCGAMTVMMDIYVDSSLENETKIQCRTAFQRILKACENYTNLEQLLIASKAYADDEIMTLILDKISKILPKNNKARRNFITNGHLKMIQSFKPDVDSELFKVIKVVNCSFPEDILQIVAGDFPERVMKTVDKYVPKSKCV